MSGPHWDVVTRNHEALMQCAPPHDFQPFRPETTGFARCKYQCRKCGGVLTGVQHRWYQIGLDHGKRIKGEG